MFTKPTAPRPAQQQIFGNDLLSQLDPNDPLLLLSRVIDWSRFEDEFAQYYSPDKGRPAIPIRRLVGLLFVKLLENLSDESVVLGYRRNPYYPIFCGAVEFDRSMPCSATELCHFRKRIGASGAQLVFAESVRLHSRYAEDAEVHIDSTVHDCRDNGMDPLHLLIGLVMGQNGVSDNHLTEAKRIHNEDYNDRFGYSKINIPGSGSCFALPPPSFDSCTQIIELNVVNRIGSGW
jgi:hypothetical protein